MATVFVEPLKTLPLSGGESVKNSKVFDIFQMRGRHIYEEQKVGSNGGDPLAGKRTNGKPACRNFKALPDKRLEAP
jgi:hypothetical protein